MSTYELPPGVQVDLGNFVLFDTRAEEFENVKARAESGAELLIRTIFSLPHQSSDDGKIVQLPKPTTPLPRQRIIPKKQPMTKWEKFAKEKGIQKKKRRDRLVLDEATGEYVRRYGKGSKNSLDRDIILPHKEGMPDDYNPFKEKKKEKKERVKQNKKKQLSNQRRADAVMKPMQAMDVAKAGPSGKKYIPKKSLNDSIAVVQKSTASVGTFDKKVAREPKQKSKGRKRKYETVSNKKNLQEEKQREKKVADRLLMGFK